LLKRYQWLMLGLLCFFLVSCAANQAQGNDVNYEETKKMIVDILKTDDGKKAIRDILADDTLKQQLVMDQATVNQAIQQTLTSEQGQQFWKKQMEDPKFAETFAKSMEKQQETVMKNLMNDPDYQKKMIELMQSPEMEKNVMTLLKGNEFRSHLQDLIGEAFENPIFRAEIADMLKQVTDEQLKAQKGQQGDNQEGGGGGQGGGNGSGGGA